MKNHFLICLVAVSAITTNIAKANNFTNGGFEDSTTSGWTVGGGFRGGVDNSTISPSGFLPGGAFNTDTGTRGEIIDSTYVDPTIGSDLGSTVYAGSYAYRAEDTTSGGYATAISQSVSNYTDANIFFAWKAVLENGGHSILESAIMTITLIDDTTGDLLISRSYNAGAGGVGVDARFTVVGDLFYTAAWQIEQLTIDSSRNGHDFTISLLAADCELSGHTGYAYIDGFGGVSPPVTAVPEPETYGLVLAGLSLIGTIARRRKKQA